MPDPGGCRPDWHPDEAAACHISDLTTVDIPALAALEKDCFPRPWSGPAYAESLARPGTGGFTATRINKDLFTGFVFFGIITDEMHIYKLAVAESYRHRGIGTRLMTAAMELAYRREIRRILLEFRESNRPASRFYRKLGFFASGRRNQYYDNQEDAILMTKTMKEACHGNSNRH